MEDKNRSVFSVGKFTVFFNVCFFFLLVDLPFKCAFDLLYASKSDIETRPVNKRNIKKALKYSKMPQHKIDQEIYKRQIYTFYFLCFCFYVSSSLFSIDHSVFSLPFCLLSINFMGLS